LGYQGINLLLHQLNQGIGTAQHRHRQQKDLVPVGVGDMADQPSQGLFERSQVMGGDNFAGGQIFLKRQIRKRKDPRARSIRSPCWASIALSIASLSSCKFFGS
jgi:hypothetical protein